MSELYSIHEELLEPVLSNLVFVSSTNDGDESNSPSRVQLKLDDSAASADTYELRDTLLQEPAPVSGGDASALETDTEGALHLRERSTNERDAADTSVVLDHRCIVSIADVFYCVRVQEVWDAELMLDVTMEDPETLTAYACVVRESELVDIAQYLFESGLVRENYAALVKNGLPQTLHAPVCKLLKRHMQPVSRAADAHETQHNHAHARHDAVRTRESESRSVGKLSIDSLLRQVHSRPTRSSAAPDDDHDSSVERVTQECDRADNKWCALMPLESAVHADAIANATAQLRAWSFAGTRSRSTHLRKSRRGCRYLGASSSSPSSSPCSEYVVVDIWSGFRDFAGLVLEVHLVSMPSTHTRESEPTLRGSESVLRGDKRPESHDRRLVITLQSLEDACRALGLASLSLS